MNKSLNRAGIIHTLRKQLPHLNAKYGVEKIALYGSFAKGTASKQSDVDILVQLGRPLGLEFVQLAFDLEKSLGRKVDLATFDTFQRGLANPRYTRMASDIQRTLHYV
ncbi:MAG: nucleotidyltransferase family protein [Chloroflexota bacterium]|nr:nucleotidyltransferase family protein [Chloroflexota bacterium]